MKTPKWIIWCGILLAILWVAIVISSGAGFNPLGIHWNFANPGGFGDSFGPIGTLMAVVAALSAVTTLRYQQQELTRLRDREYAEDQRAAKLAFEQTFFQLLDHHRGNVNSIDIEGKAGTRRGQDAFRSVAYFLRNHKASGDSNAWKITFKKYQNDLGHYFRFLYHFINYINDNGGNDSYSFARLVRATLSESELLLLAMNCAHGEGREKFAKLVERYALLHNLSDEAVSEFSLREHFDVGAFKHPEHEKVKSESEG